MSNSVSSEYSSVFIGSGIDDASSLESASVAPPRRKGLTKSQAKFCLVTACALVGTLFLSNASRSNPYFSMRHELAANSLPSSKSRFHPVYIYSNRELADKEVPAYTDHNAYSQVLQDKIILALTKANDEKSQDKVAKQKFFVDLAANDAIALSNTLHLEQNNWEGVCIEGNPEYWYNLGRYRKCTAVGAFVGGKPSEDGKEVEIALKGVYGGIVAEGMDNAKEQSTVKRELVSIYTVFKETNVPSMIDYLSLDVEGAESLVMSDFPWEDYKMRFMTIERPKDDLRGMLQANGYVMVNKQLSQWGETLWAHEKSINLSQEEMLEIIAHPRYVTE